MCGAFAARGLPALRFLHATACIRDPGTLIRNRSLPSQSSACGSSLQDFESEVPPFGRYTFEDRRNDHHETTIRTHLLLFVTSLPPQSAVAMSTTKKPKSLVFSSDTMVKDPSSAQRRYPASPHPRAIAELGPPASIISSNHVERAILGTMPRDTDLRGLNVSQHPGMNPIPTLDDLEVDVTGDDNGAEALRLGLRVGCGDAHRTTISCDGMAER